MKTIELKLCLKLFAVFVLCSIFLGSIQAQNYKKNWASGKLVWEDFQGLYSIGNTSELNYVLGYINDKIKCNDTFVTRIKSFCYVDKKLSSVNPSYKTQELLRYNQVIFDILEFHRRRFQYELDRIYSMLNLEDILHNKLSECNNEIEKFQNESNKGLDTMIINKWEKLISEKLIEFGGDRIPGFTRKNYGYGVHLGFGSGSFVGSIGKYFGSTFNFIYGFDFAYKKSILFLDATFAAGKVKQNLAANTNWNKVRKVNAAIIGASYGYICIDNSKIKLAPFAGLGVIEIRGKTNDNPQQELTITDFNFIFGLNTDFKIRKGVNLIPGILLRNREFIETSIKTKLYLTRANYFNNLNGLMINLSVGICGFGNAIKLTN
jgi:hypothetical protein